MAEPGASVNTCSLALAASAGSVLAALSRVASVHSAASYAHVAVLLPASAIAASLAAAPSCCTRTCTSAPNTSSGEMATSTSASRYDATNAMM